MIEKKGNLHWDPKYAYYLHNTVHCFKTSSYGK